MDWANRYLVSGGMTCWSALLGMAVCLATPVDAATDPSVVCHLKFEDAGGKLADASGHGHHAVARGAVRCDGVDGHGRYFDGREQWVELPMSAAIRDLKALTVEAWCRPDRLAHTQVIMAPNWGLRWRLGQTSWFHVSGADRASLLLQSPTAVALTFPGGTWIHLMGTYDGRQACLYMNGKLERRRKVPATFKPRHEDRLISIGKGYPTGEGFNGTIDEIVIHNKALTTDEAVARYKWCKTHFEPAPPPPKAVPGTLDGQVYKPAWKAVQLDGYWARFSNTGQMTVSTPLLSLAGAAGRKQNFYKRVTGGLTMVPRGPSTLRIEGETSDGLGVRQTVTMEKRTTRVEIDVKAIGRRPGAPYLYAGFHMWPCAVPFVGYTTDGLVKGKMLDLDHPVRFVRGLEMVHLGMFPGRQARSIRVRYRFDKGTAFHMGAARGNPSKWIPGYANTGMRIGPTELASWKQGDRCRIAFEVERVPGTEAPVYDASKAAAVTRDLPFDFAPTYEAKPGHVAVKLTDRHAPVFGVGETAVLIIHVPPEQFSRNPTVHYQVADAYTKKVVKREAMKPTPTWWTWQPHVQFRSDRRGVYDLHVEVRDEAGKVITAADRELVFCGPIEQPVLKPGTLPKRTLVDQVNCVKPDGKHAFYSRSNKSHVIQTKAGPARATLRYDQMKALGTRECDWFGFRFRLKHPDRVHMIEVDYPDVDNMTVSVCVFEPTHTTGAKPGMAVQRVASGVKTGDVLPVSNKIQTMRSIYFASAPWCAVQVQDLHHSHHTGEHPGAATAIRVYELDGPLPRLAGSDKPTERLFGTHTEWGNLFAGAMGHGTLRKEYARFPDTGGYAAGFRAAENLVRYLRYRGETMYMYGIYRYRSAQFLSRWFPRSGAAGKNIDMAAVLAKMFEYNNLKLVLCTLVNTPLSIGRLNDVADWEMRQGADSCQQVSPDGLQDIRNAFFMAPNPFHPRVQREYARLADELGDQYGRYKSVAGVAWVCGNCWEPSLMRGATRPDTAKDVFEDRFYRYTWDDTTMRAFAKRFNLTLPGKPDDPKRFRTRYDWVMKNHRQRYTDFRCEQMLALHKTLRDALCRHAPHLRHIVIDQHTAQLYHFRPGKIAPETILKAVASNPKLYVGVPRITYLHHMSEATGKRFTEHGRTPRAWVPALRKLLLDEPTARALDTGARGGCFLHRQFYENNSYYDPERKWVFDFPTGPRYRSRPTWLSCISYPQPGGRAFLEDFVLMLARATPSCIAYMWSDGTIALGHERLLGEFGAAFRCLPIGLYVDVHSGDGVFVRGMKEAHRGERVFYAVSIKPTPAQVAIRITGAVKQVRDAVTGETLPVANDGACRVALRPFELRVFRASPGSVTLAPAGR